MNEEKLREKAKKNSCYSVELYEKFRETGNRLNGLLLINISEIEEMRQDVLRCMRHIDATDIDAQYECLKKWNRMIENEQNRITGIHEENRG